MSTWIALHGFLTHYIGAIQSCPHWCYQSFSSIYQKEEQVLGPICALAQVWQCHMARPQIVLGHVATTRLVVQQQQ